jgi:endo-1,4-beta-xylanase
VPIGGVGFQCSFIVGKVPGTLQNNMEAFVELSIEFAIAELDICMALPETDSLLSQQQADYETVIGACNAVKACIDVTV